VFKLSSAVGLMAVAIRQELCTSYNRSSCHHTTRHLHHPYLQ